MLFYDPVSLETRVHSPGADADRCDQPQSIILAAQQCMLDQRQSVARATSLARTD